ncbi:hypothetical protein [Dyadobacter sp. BHUBP1]|uniref:hypothetical protein n=1 Tax=Dyadobacter sp. BHUBP1 TaxID=3424178 RepID=UPI003D351F7D
MEAAKSLRQPTNWQDFETLCKKLWGEIWNCAEIKKNGRSGQNQNGVDVYGIPSGEIQYYGIQCKGKDEYTHRQFTEPEIIEEIDKAKLFQPPLKKLYLATTAVKDAKTEEFVRAQNLSSIKAGMFEIHLFCWEDIVELIDENRRTHDWYANNQKFRSTQSVKVVFDGGTDRQEVWPIFNEVTYLIDPSKYFEPRYYDDGDGFIVITMPDNFGKVWTNNSFFGFRLSIHNTGTLPIEKFQLSVNFEGEISQIATTNRERSESSLANVAGLPLGESTDYQISESGWLLRILPRKEILIGEDFYTTDKIYIKPLAKSQLIELRWKLISKDFRDSGTLTICSNPQFVEVTKGVDEDDMPEDDSPVIEDCLE